MKKLILKEEQLKIILENETIQQYLSLIKTANVDDIKFEAEEIDNDFYNVQIYINNIAIPSGLISFSISSYDNGYKVEGINVAPSLRGNNVTQKIYHSFIKNVGDLYSVYDNRSKSDDAKAVPRIWNKLKQQSDIKTKQKIDKNNNPIADYGYI